MHCKNNIVLLAKYLVTTSLVKIVTILSPLVGQTDSNVRNSSDFAEFITSQILSPDETLVSFDVVSLLTNVLVDLASQVASDRL